MSGISAKPLQGQVAVVTGAGRGIGRAIALAYAQAGASVCCCARSTMQIDETAQAIRAAGGQALSVVTDVADYAAVQQLFERTASQWGRVDLLAACAGSAPENLPVADSDPARWREALDVNLIGAYHQTKAAIPHLRKVGTGKIILIGSGQGHRGSAGRSAYAISKAGLWMLTRVLAAELEVDRIAVNELVPGPVHTAFIAGREEAVQKAGGGVEWMKQPEDVIPLALFLATQPALGPTGQSFSLTRREL